MAVRPETAASIFEINSPARTAAFAFLAVLATILTTVPTAQAQTFTVLHTFSSGDGSEPEATMTMDRAGNLYGTTSAGGAGFGTVFRLSRAGSGWILATLHAFRGGSDGSIPLGGVVFGPDGTLYGTTSGSGTHGAGVVFNLRPPATACPSIQCPWKETVLYSFMGDSDGANPGFGNLTFDSAGNIYGTTSAGGTGCSVYGGCGVVFKLSQSGGAWTESVIYAFVQGNAQTPYGGVTFDSGGHLYGTTSLGGQFGLGTVYELTPSGSGWLATTLHNFAQGQDGANPYAAVVIDQHGNLYGTTLHGYGGEGVVYELQPSGNSWIYSILSSGGGPYDGVTLDNSGDLYASGSGDFESSGNVFKLSPGSGGWIYTDLHDFNEQQFGQGSIPVGGVVLDASGRIYGTTFQGGDGNPPCGEGCGVVWEITP